MFLFFCWLVGSRRSQGRVNSPGRGRVDSPGRGRVNSQGRVPVTGLSRIHRPPRTPIFRKGKGKSKDLHSCWRDAEAAAGLTALTLVRCLYALTRASLFEKQGWGAEKTRRLP